jgi:NADP-dependent 3-hydroxy acid dehydrogenase YdfG
MSGKLDGKIAVSSGIGPAAARRFVRGGAYVFITGRRQAELDRAKALIGACKAMSPISAIWTGFTRRCGGSRMTSTSS